MRRLKQSYATESDVPELVREFYAPGADGRLHIQIESEEPPKPRSHKDLRSPAERAKFLRENGIDAYMELPAD